MTFTYIPSSWFWNASIRLMVRWGVAGGQNLSPVVSVVATYPAGTSSTIFLDGSDDGSTVAATYSVNNLNGGNTFLISQHEFWRLRVSAAATDNTNPPTFLGLNLLFGSTGTWISPILDTGASTLSYGSIVATSVLNGGTIAFFTQSSADGVTWNAFIATSMSGQILSPLLRYLHVMVVITLGPGGVTPLILDITAGWTTGGGSVKYPLLASFVFQFDSQLLDVQQSLADNLGGDSSILNDIIVQAQPLVLTGTNTDTVWQGTVGTPPVSISNTDFPFAVVPGTYVGFTPYISGRHGYLSDERGQSCSGGHYVLREGPLDLGFLQYSSDSS